MLLFAVRSCGGRTRLFLSVTVTVRLRLGAGRSLMSGITPTAAFHVFVIAAVIARVCAGAESIKCQAT